MNKVYRYILLAVVIAFLGYNSVYFKKLSEVKNQKISGINFTSLADSLYYKGILKTTKTVDLPLLFNLIQIRPDSAFKDYGNVLGIGNSAYFMVKSRGKIIDITDGNIKILSSDGALLNIDTKYIFGNAIRDASGLVKLTDFKTNADFNKVSEALNSLVREKVMPPVVMKLKKGDEISLTGALKLNKKHLTNLDISIIPVQINLQ